MGLKVKDLMTTDVIAVGETVKIREAARIMLQKGVKSLPILKGGFYHGMITVRDIVRAVLLEKMDPEILNVRDIMDQHPFFVSPDVEVEEAAKIMTKYGVRHLLVVDGRLVIGIISDRDIIDSLLREGD